MKTKYVLVAGLIVIVGIGAAVAYERPWESRKPSPPGGGSGGNDPGEVAPGTPTTAPAASTEKSPTGESGGQADTSVRISGIVQDPAGAPFGGATVRLTTPLATGSPTEGGSYATDSGKDGQFTLAGITPGRVMVHAEHKDHRRSEVVELTVMESEAVTGIELRLREGGVISGRVQDEGGKGIPSAAVYAYDEKSMQSGSPETLNVTTDSEGNFELRGVGEGTYVLGANALGYINFDAVGEATGGQKLTGQSGDDIVITLSHGASFGGRVVGAGGRGVLTFFVEVMSTQAALGDVEYPSATHEIASADGQFEIGNVGSGAKALVISAGGFASKRVDLEQYLSTAQVDLGTIELSLGATVRGSVTSDSTPVKGATVSVRSAGGARTLSMGSFSGAMEPRGMSGVTGEFAVEHVAAGRMRVTATHPDFTAASTEVEVPESGDSPTVTLEMNPGAVITGTVLDQAKRPVPRARITVYARPGGASQPSTGPRNTVTDLQGSYRVGGLPGGAYTLQAHLPTKGGLGFSQRSQLVELPAGGEVTADFIEGALCQLKGRVTDWDPEGAGGVTRNMLILLDVASGGANQTMTRIEASGDYEFPGMPPGEYKLMLGGKEVARVTLPDEREHLMEFALPE